MSHYGGELVAIGRGCKYIVLLVAHHMIGVREVEAARFVERRQSLRGTFAANCVPSHVGYFYPCPVQRGSEPDRLGIEPAEAGLIALLATPSKQLQPQTNAKDRRPLMRYLPLKDGD